MVVVDVVAAAAAAGVVLCFCFIVWLMFASVRSRFSFQLQWYGGLHVHLYSHAICASIQLGFRVLRNHFR